MNDELMNKIEIVFENLDYVCIPKEYISVAFGKVMMNERLEHLCAESVTLKILNTFECNWEKADDSVDIYEEFGKRIFEKDITYLRVHYENESYEDLWVPWEDCEDNTYKNRLQKVKMDEEENYIIEIGR